MAGLGIYADNGNIYSRLDLDFNNDKHEDASDLAALGQVIGGAVCDTATQRCDNPDFNRDGEVNADDITTFAGAMGGTYRVPAGDITAYRFLYRGYWYDKHLGIYHVRHRAYDPTIQRWLQPDPAMFIDGMNRYAYCGNEPFGLYDPMGLSALDDVAATWNGLVHGITSLFGGGATQPAMGSNQSLGSQAASGIAERAAIANEMAREQGGWGDAARASVVSHQRFMSDGMAQTASSAYGVAGNYVAGSPGITGGGAAKIASGIASIGDSIASAAGGLVATVKGGGDGAVASAYRLVRQALADGEQAAHLNQWSAFKNFKYDDMLAVPLKGSIQEVGSEHWKFHRVMEDWWNTFRANPDVRPTAGGYNDKLIEALRATGRYSEEEIQKLAKAAMKELDDVGIKPGDVIDPLPGRVPCKRGEGGSAGS